MSLRNMDVSSILRRSPRVAADAAQQANAKTAIGASSPKEESTPLPTTQLLSIRHRSSPRLASAEQQVNDATVTTASSSEWRWNETGFDPYESSTPHDAFLFGSLTGKRRITRSASRSHSSMRSSTALARPLDSRKVAFGQEVQTHRQADVHANHRDLELISVTPASQTGGVLSVEQAYGSEMSLTERLSTVTPHEHEASLALAALCMQSDERKGIQPQSVSHYLGQATKPPGKQRDIIFPGLVHAMVTELNNSARDVLEWINDGEAFVIHKPKSAKLGEALKKHFNHGNYGSLQRQLNMYGWKKDRNGKHKGAFYHKHFHRDPDKADFGSIQRQDPSKGTRRSRKRKSSSSVAAEFRPLVAAIPEQGSQNIKLVSVTFRLENEKFDLCVEQNPGESPAESSMESTTQFPDDFMQVFPVKASVPSPVKFTQDALYIVHAPSKGNNIRLKSPSQSEKEIEASGTLAVSMTPKRSPPKICDFLGSSPIAFDDIDFSSTLFGPSCENMQTLPSLVDEGTQGEPPIPIVSFHDGKTVRTSPLDASAARFSTSTSIEAAFKHLAVLGSQQTRGLPSPIDRPTTPSSKVPPPSASSAGSAPTPLNFYSSSDEDTWLPLEEFAAGISSLLFMDD